jgi:hypothetical protein
MLCYILLSGFATKKIVIIIYEGKKIASYQFSNVLCSNVTKMTFEHQNITFLKVTFQPFKHNFSCNDV